MACMLQDVSVEGLRQTHFEQLMSYVNEAEDSGEYWGRRDYFDRRHNDIVEWLEGILELLNDGWVIPKKRKVTPLSTLSDRPKAETEHEQE